MADVVISTLAKADMQETADYIRLQLRNPQAAEKLLRRLRDSMASLRTFPEMGAPVMAAGRQFQGYRYLICGNYMVFYHFTDGTVFVDRVLYGRRDYLALLFGEQFDGDDQANDIGG
jgi:addiction module RelE/StbE family toxin